MFEQLKRLSLESLISIGIVTALVMGFYNYLPNPLQLVLFKILLISFGVLHAHFMGKLIIHTKIDWSQKLEEQKGAFYARIGFYIIIPICYALGG